MAKKLRTYETSLGFFDLAIAAPSMKAALEAWGALQGTRQTTPRSRRRRRSEEGRTQGSEPQATKECEEDRRSGGSQGRARIREGAGTPRTRTRKGGGGSTKTARTAAEGCR